MEYRATTEDITILVSTRYNHEKSSNESTYYNYSVIFLNNTIFDWEIVGRSLTVRPNTMDNQSKDITINSLSQSIKGAILPYEGEYVYDTFSANNGPVSVRGYYVLRNTTTNQLLEVKFPLTFFPKVDYDLF
jgi:uncharacterized protein affecting Mg2+/Co2+ transport